MRIIEDETEMLENRGADHLLIEFVAAATSQHRLFDRVRPKLEVFSLPHIPGHRFTEADAGNVESAKSSAAFSRMSRCR